MKLKSLRPYFRPTRLRNYDSLVLGFNKGKPDIKSKHCVHVIIYITRSELASLALSLYVCGLWRHLSSMDDIIIMHCTWTVLYQGP